jgi:hypothetical protein
MLTRLHVTVCIFLPSTIYFDNTSQLQPPVKKNVLVVILLKKAHVCNTFIKLTGAAHAFFCSIYIYLLS